MGFVEDFIDRYRKEYDFYESASRLCAQMLDAKLQAAGVRSIVTWRAKAVTRLEPKLRARELRKAYSNVSAVAEDIIDLAGVRVALYFPAQLVQVDTIIREIFAVNVTKDFPDGSTPKYSKRFGGYNARHYRVHIKDAVLNDGQKRYADAKIEIQVASVLMHAWSEVEHDLVYKPLQGELSVEEYAILDELNGLVLAGEIALERLQRSGEHRVAASGRLLANHYELAAHLLGEIDRARLGPISEAGLGRVDLLFELLKRLELRTPSALKPYLAQLHGDIETRPIADQVVDQVLAGDASRYAVYDAVRRDAMPRDRETSEGVAAPLGEFMAAWIAFETVARNAVKDDTYRRTMTAPPIGVLRSGGLIDDVAMAELERFRRLRNSVVHGLNPGNTGELLAAAERLKKLTALIIASAKSEK